MYMKKMVEIGQAANGYVIECRAPIKPKKEKDMKSVCSDYPGSTEKQFIAKDIDEAVGIVTKILPLLDDKFTSEEEFDKAFESAAK